MATIDYTGNTGVAAQLYLAYMGRPADSTSLQWWAQNLPADGSVNAATSAAFFNSPEGQAQFANLTTAQVINQAFQNLFGHAAKDSDTSLWTQWATKQGFTNADLPWQIFKAGQSSTADQANLNTRLAAAAVYTNAATGADQISALQTVAGAAVARAWLAPVTSSSDLPALNSAIPASLATAVSSATPAQTLALTTGVDTLTGGAGNDTINGTVAALSTAHTLNAGDKIDGGAGTDTLKVDMQSGFAGFSSTGGLSNVENVVLTNSGTIARSFDATGVSGVQQYTLNGAVTLASLADTKAAVVINNDAKSDVTIGYAAKVTDGTTDTQAITLNNVGTAEVKDSTGTVTTAKAAVTVTANGIETLALTTAGTNIVTLADDSATAITVTGTGSLDTNVTAKTTSFDASANTGDVKVDLSAATNAANQVKTVATGAGNDTITADLGVLAANATINGGAGADRLELSGAAATTQYQMSGVETVSVGALTGDLTFSASKATGITTIEASKDFTTKTATFASLGSADETFNLLSNVAGTSAGTSAGTISADNSGASTVNVTASDATIKAAVAGTSDTNAVALTLGNTSSVNLTVGQYADYTGTLTAGKATSITANIAGALGTGSNIVAAAATSAVITDTSKAASTLDLDAAKLTDLNVTAAGDFALTGSTLGAVERLTVNEGAGHAFDIGTGINLGAVNAVNLSGAGAVTLHNLGATGLGYGVTVTANGLSSLSTGDIKVGAAQNISVDASTVLGAVSLANSGNIAVDTSNGADTGSININVNGTTGAVKLGTLEAKDVTVDATGALSTVAYGDITAGNSVTLNGANLAANSATINASGSSLTANLNGGIKDDAFTINGATATSIKVAGDLGGLGADSVSITTGVTTGVTIDTTGLKNLGTTGTGVVITGGTGNDTIKVGAGVTTVNTDGGTDTITLLAGHTAVDTINVTGAVAGSATSQIVINNFVHGQDALNLGVVSAASGTGTAAAISNSATDLTTATSLTDALNQLAASTTAGATVSTGNVNGGVVAWGVYGGNTYVVVDNSTAATLQTTDAVIKLAGVTNLAATDLHIA